MASCCSQCSKVLLGIFVAIVAVFVHEMGIFDDPKLVYHESLMWESPSKANHSTTSSDDRPPLLYLVGHVIYPWDDANSDKTPLERAIWFSDLAYNVTSWEESLLADPATRAILLDQGMASVGLSPEENLHLQVSFTHYFADRSRKKSRSVVFNGFPVASLEDANSLLETNEQGVLLAMKPGLPAIRGECRDKILTPACDPSHFCKKHVGPKRISFGVVTDLSVRTMTKRNKMINQIYCFLSSDPFVVAPWRPIYGI